MEGLLRDSEYRIGFSYKLPALRVLVPASLETQRSSDRVCSLVDLEFYGLNHKYLLSPVDFLLFISQMPVTYENCSAYTVDCTSLHSALQTFLQCAFV